MEAYILFVQLKIFNQCDKLCTGLVCFDEKNNFLVFKWLNIEHHFTDILYKYPGLIRV